MISESILKNNMERVWLKSVLNKTFYAALAVFFFLLPLQARWIFREAALYEYGTLSVFLVEIIGWIVILLGLLQYREIRSPKLRRSDLLFITLPSFALISIVWAPDKAVAFQAAIRLLEGMLLYVIVAAPRGQATAKSGLATSAAWAFLAGAVLQASLGIYQFLTQSSFSSTLLGMALHDPQALGTAVVEFGNERWLRAYGGLPHPNVLGGYLVVALAVLLHGNMETWKHGNTKRLVGWGVLLVFLTGIFFTFSRAAWLGAVGIIILWCIQTARAAPRGQATAKSGLATSAAPLGMTILYILLLVLTFRPLVETRLALHGAERLETKSRVERVQGVGEAWRIIKAHPLVGVGIGNYTQALQQLRPNQPLYAYQPVHNVPLLVFAELGIVGLWFFVVALYLIVKQSTSAVLLSCCFVVLLMADHYLWTLPFGIFIFWSILGLFTIIHRPRT